MMNDARRVSNFAYDLSFTVRYAKGSVDVSLDTREYGSGTVSFKNPFYGKGNLCEKKIVGLEEVVIPITVGGHGKNKAERKVARAVTAWIYDALNHRRYDIPLKNQAKAERKKR